MQRSTKTANTLTCALLAGVALAGCQGAGGGVSDAGGPRVGQQTDGGEPVLDVGPGDDAGVDEDGGASPDARAGRDAGADDARAPSPTDAGEPATDASGPTPDAAPRADGGAPGDAAPPRDDAGPPPGPIDCKDVVLPPGSFALDPGGPDGQLNPAATFDGETVWVAYNRPAPEADFDVWLTAIDCAGNVRPPVQVNDVQAPNDVEPTVAVSGNRVLVAWTADTPEDGPLNLAVRYRLYDREGVAQGPSLRLPITFDGDTIEANVWMPHVAADADGFWLTASRGHPEIGTFQVFAQRLDADGVPMGPQIDVAPTPGVPQWDPGVEIAADGGVHVAWIDGQLNGAPRMARLPVGGAGFEPAELVANGTGSSISIAADGPVYVALHRQAAQGADILIRTVDAAPTLVLGADRQNDFLPVLAPGAVAWQRQIQGTRYSVWVQRLAPGPTSASPALQVPTGDPAGPFRPALARVRDDAWLVLWSEGPRSPDYRVFGRFVSP
jgi:hypothetical protein